MLIMPTNINAQSDEITVENFARKIEKALTKKPSITKNVVINAIHWMHFNHTQWHTYLAYPPEWLKVCRVEKGYEKLPATWARRWAPRPKRSFSTWKKAVEQVFPNRPNTASPHRSECRWCPIQVTGAPCRAICHSPWNSSRGDLASCGMHSHRTARTKNTRSPSRLPHAHDELRLFQHLADQTEQAQRLW